MGFSALGSDPLTIYRWSQAERVAEEISEVLDRLRLPYPVKQVGGADVAYDRGSDWLMAAVLVDSVRCRNEGTHLTVTCGGV